MWTTTDFTSIGPEEDGRHHPMGAPAPGPGRAGGAERGADVLGLRHHSYDKYMTWPGIGRGTKPRVVSLMDGAVCRGWCCRWGWTAASPPTPGPGPHEKRNCIPGGQRRSELRHPEDEPARGGHPGGMPSGPPGSRKVRTGDTPETILQDLAGPLCGDREAGQAPGAVRALNIRQYRPPRPSRPGTTGGQPGPLRHHHRQLVSGRDMEALVNSVVLTGGRGTKCRNWAGLHPQRGPGTGPSQAVERLSGDEDPAQARQRIRDPAGSGGPADPGADGGGMVGDGRGGERRPAAVGQHVRSGRRPAG